MKGLSLAQPYASLVALGLKTLETRKTRIHYRGPLVICATKTTDGPAWHRISKEHPAAFAALCADVRAREGLEDWACIVLEHLPLGRTLALVDVVGCRALVPEDLPHSFFYAPGRWAWELANVRRLKHVAARGMNGLFPVDERLVELAAP